MNPIRILYVEDNPLLRDLVAAMLEGDGREVMSCASGEEALAQWRLREFDVIVADVSLPGMSGAALAKEILAARPAQWIVFCTGTAIPAEMTFLGPNVRSLLKPFQADELDRLMAEIAQSLGRAAPAVADR